MVTIRKGKEIIRWVVSVGLKRMPMQDSAPRTCRLCITGNGLPTPTSRESWPQQSFLSAGPKACGIMTGVGRFDALDLAGNVREWCRTADDHGHQYALGGDWTSPYYSFNESFSTSPWDRSPQNGFRCVRYRDGLEPGGNILASVAKPKSLDTGPEREPFERLRAMYLYDHDLPLGRTIKSSNTPNRNQQEIPA